MKIGLISDIHSNVYGLRSVLKKLKNTDIILCAGDLTGYYTFANEVFDEIEKNKIQWIKGNFDDFLFKSTNNQIIQDSVDYTKKVIKPENLKKLKNAPTDMTLVLDGIRFKVYHGSPWGEESVYPDYKNFAKFNKVNADVIILGHTHYPMEKRIGDKIIINPGSCGQPRDYESKASCAIFDTKTRKTKFYRLSYNRRKIISAIKLYGFDQKLIDILKRKKPFDFTHGKEKK